MFQKAVVVGGCGGFGRTLSAQLTASDIAVTSVDTNPAADVVCDVTVDPSGLIGELKDCDLLLLCLPEAMAIATLEQVDKHVGNCLVVDICSVKTKVCDIALTTCLTAQYVSLHPMFGPERSMVGGNAVFIPIRNGDKSDAFRTLLEQWRLKVVDSDVATHDKVTSLVQVFTHAVLCTFANARSKFALDDDVVAAYATPVFSELQRVSQGLMAENPSLYHNIQTSNPWGEQARETLRTAVAETLEVLGGDDEQPVIDLFMRARGAPKN